MRALSLIFLTLVPGAAWAQTPAAQPDLSAILKALEGINNRLDKLEKPQNEPRRTPPAAAPAGPVSPKTAAPPKPPAKAVPGWQVFLVPWTPDGQSEAIGSFAGPSNLFTFDLHSRYTQVQNRFIYNGRSVFHPKEDGNYGFSILLQPVLVPTPNDTYWSTRFNCSGELRVNDNQIIRGQTDFENNVRRPEQDMFQAKEFYASVRMTPGTQYRMEFRVDCWPESAKKADVFNNLLSSWKKNRFELKVRGPEDMQLRPFQQDELWYVGQP